MKFLIQRLTLIVVAVLCVSSMNAQNTAVTFNLTDSFGDGWCGGNIIVSGEAEQVTGADGNCEVILEPVAFTQPVGTDSGFTTGTTWSEDVNAQVGSIMTCTWMNDPFNGETGYTIINGDGTVITMGGGGSGLPVSFVVAGPPAECPDCPPATGASLSLTGVDSFGDGWDNAGVILEAYSLPGGAGELCGTATVLDDFFFGSQQTSTADIVVPEGGSLVFTWGASCGIFAGEVVQLDIDLVTPDQINLNPVTGTCDIVPGTTEQIFTQSGNGICSANSQILVWDVPPTLTAGGLDCPDDETIVLDGGDCWPTATYCIGTTDLLIPAQELDCQEIADASYVIDGVNLFDLSPVNAVDCDPMAECTDGLYSVCGTNNDANGNTCPNYDFANLPLVIIPIFFPDNPDYDELVLNWTFTPDNTGGAGADQVSYVPIDATGTWDASMGLTGLINNFGAGVQTGSTSIDLGTFGGANTAGVAIYILSLDNANGPACLEFTGQFNDNDGKIFTVGASNDAACDAELTFEIDSDAGTVTIDYIPGVNEVCFLLSSPDGCDATTCNFTVTVDNSEIKQSLACNDHINVSVDNGCEALITADMVLEGSKY